MKRTLSLVLSLIMILGILVSMPVTVSAATSGTTGDCTWSLDGTVLTISGSGEMEDYDEYGSLMHHFYYAPWKYENITEIIIEDGVTYIGNYAFSGCDTLSVTIPNSVKSIGAYAFNCCDLVSVVIPDGVTDIGMYCFRYCTNLASVTIPDSVTNIGVYAFMDCTGLREVDWNANLESVPNDIFYNAGSKGEGIEVVFGNEAKKIPANLFNVSNDSYSNNVTSVIVSGNVTSIGSNAFKYCKNLESVVLPNSIIDIGDFAFYNCASLKSITIPDNVVNIGGRAFCGCKSLSSISIPDSVTKIGERAFISCTSLKFVEIGNGISAVSPYVFSNCTSLTSITIPDSVTCISDYAFFECTNLASITIPNGVTSIGASAFSGCERLKSITIPERVTSISSYAFKGCTGLEKVVWNAKNVADFSPSDDIFYNAGSTGTGIDVVFGDDVECIPAYLFNVSDLSYSNKVTSVTIGNNTKSVGSYAFRNCKNLKSVVIGDKVTDICDYAFFGCSNLSSVTLGESVSNIHDYAFRNCESITSIAIPDSVTSIGVSAFHNCTSLKSVTIPKSVTNLGDFAFYGCTSLDTVICPDCNFFASSNKGNSPLFDAEWTYTEHTSSDWIIDSQPTAGVPGKKHIECTECGEILETTTISQVKPVTPKVTTTNEIGGVNVTWSKVDGATKYVVYRRQGGYNTWLNVGTTTGTSLLDKNVKSGIYYVYSVRAYNSVGMYSDFVSANTQTRKYMAVPKLKTISNATNGLYITWDAVAGVTKGYRVYRRGAGSTYWTYLGTVKTTYFTDTSVKYRSGEYFRYTVIADGGYHSKFDTTGLYLKRLANPELKSAVSSSSGITVKWETVVGTTGYYVYRKTPNSSWVRIATVGGTNTTSYVDTTAKKGVTYTYTVKAVYGATTSSYYSGISCKDKY